MAQVSKYPISEDIANRIFEVLAKTFVNIKTKDEAEDFISDLLTPTEKIMLAKRIAIAVLLEKEYDYRAIQRIIRVSAPTVASVNVVRRYRKAGYKKLIERILREEKINAMFEDAVNKFLSVPASGGKGSGVWKYLKQESDKRKRKKNRNS